MKTICSILILISLTITAFSQDNFMWEKKDSVDKKQNQIYSDTKLFIAKTWVSAQNVIQNDDKEGGVIVVKGSSVREVSFMMGGYVYIYSYTMTFMMKDGKYKVNIDQVQCNDAHMASGGRSIAILQPFDGENCPPTGTITHPGLPKGRAIKMMAEFKQELNGLVQSYEEFIKKPSTAQSGW